MISRFTSYSARLGMSLVHIVVWFLMVTEVTIKFHSLAQDYPQEETIWVVSCSHRGVPGAHALRRVVLDFVLAGAPVLIQSFCPASAGGFPSNISHVLIDCAQVRTAVHLNSWLCPWGLDKNNQRAKERKMNCWMDSWVGCLAGCSVEWTNKRMSVEKPYRQQTNHQTESERKSKTTNWRTRMSRRCMNEGLITR